MWVRKTEQELMAEKERLNIKKSNASKFLVFCAVLYVVIHFYFTEVPEYVDGLMFLVAAYFIYTIFPNFRPPSRGILNTSDPANWNREIVICSKCDKSQPKDMNQPLCSCGQSFEDIKLFRWIEADEE